MELVHYNFNAISMRFEFGLKILDAPQTNKQNKMRLAGAAAFVCAYFRSTTHLCIFMFVCSPTTADAIAGLLFPSFCSRFKSKFLGISFFSVLGNQRFFTNHIPKRGTIPIPIDPIANLSV